MTLASAIGRRIEARLAVDALPPCCSARRLAALFYGLRIQYASELLRDLLKEHDFVGSTSRRDNPYENPLADSLMKALKVEAVYLMVYTPIKGFGVCRFIGAYNERRSHSASECLSPT